MSTYCALLSVRWLERYGYAAPIEFGKLLHLIEDEHALLADIDSLLAKKRAAPEMGLDRPVPSIDAFIEAELARLEIVNPERVQRTDVLSQLNGVFHRALAQAWA